MTPTEYADLYLKLTTVLDNDLIVTVAIDKYLQNNGSTRNKNGLAAKDAIIGAMAAETKTTWAARTYNIGGYVVGKVDTACVFMGKGSPNEVADAVWLASRYGLIKIDPPRKNRSGVPTRTLTGFCDDCVGLDCNGFVNNYLGFDRDKSIDTYDVNYPKSRRQTLREVVAGDVLLFIEEDDATAKNAKAGRPAGTLYKHIAMIDQVTAVGQDQLQLTLVQSSGGNVGLHVSTSTVKVASHGKGVYYRSGTRSAYIVPPPAGAGDPKA